MATLEGQTIAGSYKDLLQVSNSNSGVDATARAVSDGEGTATLLYLSTTEVYSPGTGGTSNTAFGKNAGDALSSGGNYNVFLGEEAGSALAVGLNNIAIGYGAFDAADNGEDDNIAIGLNALGDANHASTVRNIAIGSGAGDGIGGIQGANIDNIFIGYDAGGGTWDTAVSQYNIGIGSYAMDAAMNGALYNTGIGYAALGSLTQGDQNTVVGWQAGDAINTGSWNILMGVNTGGAITTGGENTFLGSSAGGSLTTGSNNVAIGSGAFDAAALGETQNVAVGQDAMGSVAEGASDNADQNVAIGRQALLGGNLGDNSRTLNANIAIGNNALDATSSAQHNYTIAIGQDAGTAISHDDASGAVLVGHQSGYSITDGGENTAVGYQTLKFVSTGHGNTALGMSAGRGSSSAGTYEANTLIGKKAGFELDEGSHNVCIGFESGVNFGTANYNVAIGSYAMDAAAGSHASNGEDANIAIGRNAMGSVNTGSDAGARVYANVAIGDGALLGGSYGSSDLNLDYNIAIGTGALDATGGAAQGGTIAIGVSAGTNVNHDNASGSVFIGHTAASSVTSADRNIAIGYQALLETTTGGNNTVIGYNAMDGTGDVPASEHNTFIGVDAGGGDWANNVCTSNVGIGNYALDDNMDGALRNTAVGYQALTGVTSGDDNIGIGMLAGHSLTTGTGNIIIGKSSDVSAVGGANQTAIGYGITCTGDNDVALGNTSVDSIKGQVSFGDYSDVRIKKDITDTDIGLEFINQLKPRKFKRVAPKDYPEEIRNDFEKDYGELKHPDTIVDGMIAQEVKETIDSMGVSFSGWHENDNTKQELQYATFVMPLIKAVQELSAKVEELEAKLK